MSRKTWEWWFGRTDMFCDHCGETGEQGAFFCGSCGRPLGFKRSVETTLSEPAGLEDVPPPARSREETPVAGGGAKALCSRCLGAYPEAELATVDGAKFCRDCNTLTASHSTREYPSVEGGYEGDPRTVQMPDDTWKESPSSWRQMALILALVVAGVGVFAAIALPGSDRIDKLLSGVSDGEGGFRLAQTYVSGESFEYGLEMNVTCTIEAGSTSWIDDDFSGDFGMEMAGLIRIDVLSVDSNGNGRVQLGFSGFDARIGSTLDDVKPHRGLAVMCRGLSETTLHMTLDPYGKVIGETVSDGPPLPNEMNLDQLFRDGFAEAPRGELRVGDEWTCRTSLKMENVGPAGIGVEAEYEVVGRKNYNGRDCLVIAVEGTMSGGSGRMPSVMGADMDMDVEIKGAMFIEERSGCLVKSAMDVEMSVSISGTGGSLDMDMVMSMDVELK